MIKLPVPLDGNAAAGQLSDLFAIDITRAIVTCENCGREGALATLSLYGGGVGTVLRCPGCEAVNLRLLDTGSTLNLDLRGCARLSVQVAPRYRSQRISAPNH